MNKPLATAIAALSIAAIPVAGLAEDGQKTRPAQSGGEQGLSFDTLDANKDGRISMPEASADPRLVETFSTADKNGDGYLDSSEYENGAKQPRK